VDDEAGRLNRHCAQGRVVLQLAAEPGTLGDLARRSAPMERLEQAPAVQGEGV